MAKRSAQQPQTAVEAQLGADEQHDDGATQFERRHVTAVYDAIAEHFAATRHAPWPLVHQFVRALPPHATVLDVGCGNGKYLRAAAALRPPSRPLYIIGADMCEPLLRYAQREEAAATAPTTPGGGGGGGGVMQQFMLANALQLPLRDASVDAALNIAVVHHLCSRQRRIRALRETARVLRAGGRALIYVWALERQREHDAPARSKMLRRRFHAQDVLVPWHLRAADHNNVLQPWHRVLKRFYHVYSRGELLLELQHVPDVRVVRTYYDHQNWCVQLEKQT